VVDALLKRTSSIDHATLNGITTDPSQGAAPNVSGTSNTTTAQGIFAETLQLPFPPDVSSCLPQNVALYVAVFYAGADTVAAITLDQTGCEIVRVSSNEGDASLEVPEAQGFTYWNDLGNSFGILGLGGSGN
jgi:hypothetical protein